MITIANTIKYLLTEGSKKNSLTLYLTKNNPKDISITVRGSVTVSYDSRKEELFVNEHSLYMLTDEEKRSILSFMFQLSELQLTQLLLKGVESLHEVKSKEQQITNEV